MRSRTSDDDTSPRRTNPRGEASPRADTRASRSPNASPETAEKIRAAAIEQFAELGFAKTTVRSIATTAHVSPGLVIHHFGSKAALRTACDDFVFESIVAAKRTNSHYTPLALNFFLSDPTMRTNLAYLVTSLLDPSKAGQRYFDHYVESTQEYVETGFEGISFRQSEDPRGQAVTIASLALAPLMLLTRVSNALGTEGIEDTLSRLGPHLIDFYTNGLLAGIPETIPEPNSAAPNSDR